MYAGTNRTAPATAVRLSRLPADYGGGRDGNHPLRRDGRTLWAGPLRPRRAISSSSLSCMTVPTPTIISRSDGAAASSSISHVRWVRTADRSCSLYSRIACSAGNTLQVVRIDTTLHTRVYLGVPGDVNALSFPWSMYFGKFFMPSRTWGSLNIPPIAT
jgi:hypothetical protein